MDGYRQLEEIGVTDVIAMPWLFEGVGFEAGIGPKKDAVKKFANEVISQF